MLERRETETRFIPARVTDNAFNNPEYRRVLEGLTGWQKRAWLEGDWDIAAGQYFTTFRREVHVDRGLRRHAGAWSGLPRWTTGMRITRSACWAAGMATGTRSSWTNTRSGCGCRSGTRRRSRRCWRGIKIGDRKLELADLKRFVAGADVFRRQSDGTTIAAQYAKQGITLRCANTDRVNGWAEVMQGFGDARRRGSAGRRCSFTSGAGG